METRWDGGIVMLVAGCGLAGLALLGFAPPAGAGWSAEEGGTEITFSGGYQYGGSFEDEEGELELEPAANFGFTGSYARSEQPNLHGEAAYSRQRTQANLRSSSIGEPTPLFDVDMHYFLLGAIYHFPQSRRLVPFAGLYLGVTTANPVGDAYDSATFFAITPVGGLKAYFTPRLGLRAQARLLAPIRIDSGTIFCTDGACAISLSAGSVIWQGDVSLGALLHF